MISASVGIGTGSNAYGAGRDAVLSALAGMPDRHARALIVFGSATFDQDELLHGITDTAPGTLIVGCSTAGEISTEGLATEKSVVAMALGGDGLDAWGAVGDHLMWNARQAGSDCAKDLQYASAGYLRSVLIFLDVIAGNGEMAITGMRNRFGKTPLLSGAAAGDNLLFFKTYQYFGKDAHSGAVVGLGLGGNFTVGTALSDGFLPIGVPRTVTKSEGVTVREINNVPAIKMFEDYLGMEHSSELHEHLLSDLAVTFPLGIIAPGGDRMVSRNPIYADKQGGIVFTAPVPVGSAAHIMVSDSEQTLASARDAAERAMKALGGKTPRAALVFDAVARRKLLGANADEEIHAIQNVIGREVPLAGFYGYAQVETSAEEEYPIAFHNASLLVWIIGE